MIRYIVESASHEFMAYNEADGSLIGMDADPQRALAKLLRKVHLRDKMAALSVGARVSVAEGMGETAFGVIAGRLTNDGRIGVKYDGSVDPEGQRLEPYLVYVGIDHVFPDPDQAGAIADKQRMLPGYMRIEATV